MTRASRGDTSSLAATCIGVALLGLIGLGCGNADAPAKEPEGEPAAESSDTAGGKPASIDSVVRLDSTAQRLAGVELVTVGRADGGELVANGTITYNANRVAVVAPRSEGRIRKVLADLGQQVRAGTVLATVESPEVGRLRGELERARAAMEVARRNYDREKRLFEQSISSQKELLAAEGEFRTAEADFLSAQAGLRALGASGGEGSAYGLATPVSGAVVERNASPGQLVDASTNLFTVADLRNVWITVDIYEGDLTRVSRGAKVTVVPTALKSERFAGHVTYAGGVVDTASRAFKVRVDVENPGLRLRPGMFAQVRIEAPAKADTSGVVTLPEVAVQELNGRQVVFTAGDSDGQFTARPVRVGARLGEGMVQVIGGLKPGDRVVAAGAFQIKSELTKASFGEEE